MSELGEVDEDTFRFVIGTDNHLGYLERDPVRGLDSFCAFEETLYHAKKHKVSKSTDSIKVFLIEDETK